ncbi:MAG TPA: hypothetical protein VN081_05100 [Dongiaceae bacterium]|nr:hypothetical protein [Dongiaceae bacterium]
MAIVSENPKQPVVMVPDQKTLIRPNCDAPFDHIDVQPGIHPKGFGDTIIDNRYEPRDTLLTFVAGSSWTVEYFQRILDKNSALEPLQIGLPAPYQQYKLYKNFELKVTSALSTSQNPQTKEMAVTGGSNVYPGLTPNLGDMFIATNADGARLLLAVTASLRMSIMKDTGHTIEYQVVGYLTPERENDLRKKTIETVYFVKDYLFHGQNPYLEENQLHRLKDLSALYKRILADYLGTFFSTEFQVLLIPDQPEPAYDHYINKKVITWFSQEEHKVIQRIQPLNMNSDQAFKMTTVLDAIEQLDGSLLYTSVQEVLLANTAYMRDYPALNGIFWSGVRWMIYPKDRRTDVDRHYNARWNSVVYGQRLANNDIPRWSSLRRQTPNNVLGDLCYNGNEQELPDIVPVNQSDYYIFSRNFYQPSNGPLASKFEVLVRETLDGKAINVGVLRMLGEQAQKWYNLERFYYTPILLALMKVALIRGS